MPSARKSEASRINGAKSRGPKTAQGRANSSMNATKHGLTAKTLILQNENKDDFLKMFNAYFDLVRPTNEREIDAVSNIVAARWRLCRVWRSQTAILDLEMETQATKFKKQSRAIDQDRLAALAFSAAADTSGFETALRADINMTRKYRRAVDELRRLRGGNLLNENRILQNEPELPDLSPLNTTKAMSKISTEPKNQNPVGQL